MVMRMCKWWHEWTILAVALQWAMLTGREWAAAQAPASGGWRSGRSCKGLWCAAWPSSAPCPAWETRSGWRQRRSSRCPSTSHPAFATSWNGEWKSLEKRLSSMLFWDVVFLSGRSPPLRVGQLLFPGSFAGSCLWLVFQLLLNKE